jgi:UDP-N-acetylmuramoyl-tripeptide--D-alanyl-D-alanine ligase
MNFTVKEMSEILKAELHGCDDFVSRIINGVSIDSRTVSTGDVFFGIKGENFNGGDFIAEAYRRGASAAVIGRNQDVELLGIENYLLVNDSVEALQVLAKTIRKNMTGLKIAGITGSAGKTTTKEMTFALLKDFFKVAKTEGNLNNLYGLPLCLSRLKGDEDVFVAELGMSFAGELKKLVEIANPDVGVLLNVHPVHTVNFDSIEDLANAKAELFQNMRQDATVIYNLDNEWSARIGERYPGRRITYGIESKGTLWAKNIEFNGFESADINLIVAGNEYKISVPRFGEGNVYNFLAAASIAFAMGVDPQEFDRRIKGMAYAAGRGNVFKLRENIIVLDDSYNSNPVAMEMLLGFLERYRADGRKVVVAGDMLELGRRELEEHFRIGKIVAKSDIDMLITVGKLSRNMIEGALEEGMKQTDVLHFENSSEAAEKIAKLIEKNDLVLVKGSHGIHTDVIVEKLKKSFE